jgi:hypothetical protein
MAAHRAAHRLVQQCEVEARVERVDKAHPLDERAAGPILSQYVRNALELRGGPDERIPVSKLMALDGADRFENGCAGQFIMDPAGDRLAKFLERTFPCLSILSVCGWS